MLYSCLCWRHLELGIFHLLMSIMHCLSVCQFFFWYSQECNNTFMFFLLTIFALPGTCSARPNMTSHRLSLTYGIMWPQIAKFPLLFFSRLTYYFSYFKIISQVLNTSQLDLPNPDAIILFFWVDYFTLFSLLLIYREEGFPPFKTVERSS